MESIYKHDVNNNKSIKIHLIVTFAIAVLCSASASADASANRQVKIPGNVYDGRELIVTGQYITPLAAPGATYKTLDTELRPDGDATIDGAYTTSVSPDGNTLLVLTNGYNASLLFPYKTMEGKVIDFPYLDPITGKESEVKTLHTQWVFVYDISSGDLVKKQMINIPSAYAGIAWSPNGKRFYVSGGQDDRVYIYKNDSGKWIPDAPFILLGHNSNNTAPKPDYDGGIFKDTPAGKSEGGKAYGLNFGAMTAGVAVSGNGLHVYAVNMQNDSVSIIDAVTREVIKEVRLFIPGSDIAKGAFPIWVEVLNDDKGYARKLYVTSVRDGQVISIDVNNNYAQKVIDLGGAPTKSIITKDKTKLYVVNPDLDEVAEIDTSTDSLLRRISMQRPDFKYWGANPNSLTLANDSNTLYVTLGGENAIAVVDLSKGQVKGRIPTAWYPTSLSLTKDNSKMFVVNFKSTGGANPGGGGLSGSATEYQKTANPTHKKQHVQNMLSSGIASMPVPDDITLQSLTKKVDENNHFDKPERRQVSEMMEFLQKEIKHVIYIMRENRSYDQVFGDLPQGNGDPRLTLFGEDITPNQHKLATKYVTLDNFYAPNESSGDGWAWVTQGHGNEFLTTVHQMNDGAFFQAIDFATMLGVPRQQNVALPVTLEGEEHSLLNVRSSTYFDPTGESSILPGSRSPAVVWGADDHSENAKGGYLWDSVLRAGKTVRHYGLWTDGFPYYQFNSKDNFANTFFVTATPNAPGYPPIERKAFEKKQIQAVASTPGLLPYTDPFYRGFDMNVPEEYRYEEWKREFDGYVKKGELPNFMPMLMPMNHIGNLQGSNVGNLNTPAAQVASNDHAIGMLVSAVTKSPFWKNTAIFILEDDSYDGPDHVHSHRIPALVISPYTKRNTVVSEFYNTPSMVRTITDILDVDHLGYNDALSASMDEVFTKQADFSTYDHIIPGILLQPPVDPTLVSQDELNDPLVAISDVPKTLRDAEWWAENTKQFDSEDPDGSDTQLFNKVLWEGIKGDDVPYPYERTGEDLSNNREKLLQEFMDGQVVSDQIDVERLEKIGSYE